MKKNGKTNLVQIVTASLFAAMTFALTYTLKVPSVNGYTHIGDTVIYLAASFLSYPAAAMAGAIGASLSDAVGGYYTYIIPTLIIKSLLVFCFTSRKDKFLCKRNFFAVAPAGLITVVGYYLAEILLFALASGSFIDNLFNPATWTAVFWESVPGNAVQAITSGALYLVLCAAFDSAKVKQKIIRKN